MSETPRPHNTPFYDLWCGLERIMVYSPKERRTCVLTVQPSAQGFRFFAMMTSGAHLSAKHVVTLDFSDVRQSVSVSESVSV